MTSAERRWIGLAWLLLLLVLLSYPIRYLQQVAFGQVVFYTGMFRLMLFLAVFAYAVRTTAGETSRDQLRIIVIGYILISLLIYNVLVANFGWFYTAYGFNLFLIPPAVAVLFFVNAQYFRVVGDPDERRLVRLLLAIAVPVALFGIVQYWLDDPILRTDFASIPRNEFGAAGQAVIRLTELASTHGIRANSIFDSAIDFGHFATLFAILCCGMMLKYRKQPARVLGYGLLAGVFAIGVVSTNTRNMLLYLTCCFIGCLLIYAGLGVRALIVASLAFVAVFYGMIYGVIALAPQFFAGFYDPASLFQRARGVYLTVSQFVLNADSLLHVIFGFGYMQAVDFKFLPTTVFDNTWLDLYIYAGLCGVALSIVILLVLFNFAVRRWRETGRIAWLVVASLFMGLPLFSTINIDLDQPYFQFVFGLVVGGAAMPALRSAAIPHRNAPAVAGSARLHTI